MKLKKIASLALAGVMAVSMLAGCKYGEGSSSSSSSSEVATVPATGIAAALNAVRDDKTKDIVRLSYTESSELTAILQDAAQDEYGKDVKFIKDNSGYTGAQVLDHTKSIYKAIADKLTGVVGEGNISIGSGVTIGTTSGTAKYLLVYTAGGDLSVNTLADALATKAVYPANTKYDLNSITAAFPVQGNNMKATYSADVATVKVVSPDDATKTMWVFAVVYTQTVA